LIKDLLLLLDSITLNGNGRPSPPKNSKNFPSTLTEAYIELEKEKLTHLTRSNQLQNAEQPEKTRQQQPERNCPENCSLPEPERPTNPRDHLVGAF